MFKNGLALGLLLTFAAACGETSTQTIVSQSAFAEVEPDGTLDTSVEFLDNARSTMVSDNAGTGYAFQIGGLVDGGFATFANILPTSDVGILPTAGTVQYDAAYRIVTVVDITPQGGGLTGLDPSGNILLTADVDAGTITGSNNHLTVDGVLTDAGDIGGTVTVLQVEGQLTGMAGTDQVVGAFHGDSDTVVYSGGFIGNEVTP